MQIMNGMGKRQQGGERQDRVPAFRLQAGSTPLVMLCCFVVLTMTTV